MVALYAALRRREVRMAMKTAFVVQPFELHRKRLRPARQEPAQTESGALKKAENIGQADAGRGGAEGGGRR